MINSIQDLGWVLEDAAKRHGVECRFNTHFEAQNWELSWWTDSSRHRLDFQPGGVQGVTITHYRDTYSFMPRFWSWARAHIPYVPSMATTEFERLGHIAIPAEEKKMIEVIGTAISETKKSRSSQRASRAGHLERSPEEK